MKSNLTLIAFLCIALAMNAQTAEFFRPYKSVNLRLPAVPLIVNDPYFSIWSPYNALNEGSTSYWYGKDIEKPIEGLVRVDGAVYRFMGKEKEYVLDKAIVPMACDSQWTAKITNTPSVSSGWTALTFDDSAWNTALGAFGNTEEYRDSYIRTEWRGDNTNIWIRRKFRITAEELKKDLYLIYSHDDIFELYLCGLNGHKKIIDTGYNWGENFVYHLTESDKALLAEGENMIAAHCFNRMGGSLVDFGIYENVKTPVPDIRNAVQKSVDVLATNTYYTFTCGPVELDVVFTAPMLIDNLDLLSTPINYVSYQVRSTDGAKHRVQVYFSASPQIAVNDRNDPTISRRIANNGVRYYRTGNRNQILHGTGDHTPIDWGYLYLPEINGTAGIYSVNDAERVFATEGRLPAASKTNVVAERQGQYPLLAYTHDFGDVTHASTFMMIGYNEVKDVEFLNRQYTGYWARNGKTIYQAFEEMRDNYNEIMTKCRALDKTIYDDGLAAGNVKYAELLSGSYRHVIAAHKLFQDRDGDLLFFSRENNSGGFVNTVDLTYPESPLFLKYNHELQKAMMTSIFKYCESDRWGFTFAAHDLGDYPMANNQNYAIRFPEVNGSFGGNMPIEESGNLVTLAATISMLDGNTTYAERFWDTLKKWTDYLAEYGQDPEDQLCTDDFAGRSTHNTNLSLKAIMGVAGFAMMAKIKGDQTTYDTYMAKAKSMAAKWEHDALDASGTHYKRTLDLDGTWSQKYNMIWDKLWKINIIPNNAMQREIDYYLTIQNKYGLPLDNRSEYTKSDWIMWTASMAPDKETFLKFSDLVYKYVDETESRVPISDWHYTESGNMVGFRARSVIGGYWMKVLMDSFEPKVLPPTGIDNVASSDGEGKIKACYNVVGQAINAPMKGLNIVEYANGEVRKVFIK